MEPKKNPKYDVHQKRGVLLHVGLIVSLILVISAFKWAIPIQHSKTNRTDHLDPPDVMLIDYPQATNFKNPEAPKPDRVQAAVLIPNIVEISDEHTEAGPEKPIDIEDFNLTGGFGPIDIPIEKTEPDTFRIVEKMPEPVGGWEAFYNTLKKNTKYPRKAERMGSQGKVFVEFTVNDQGKLSNFKILKGVGNGCDEEASRVLALTKWNAGKQRGRPVNVRMVQPIVFSLNPQ